MLVCGVGVNDANYVVKPKSEGKQCICPFYQKWSAMLKRCYSEKYQEGNATYAGCSVCDEWLTFSNFKAWMVSQDWKGKQLDKDIVISGNRVYGPDTCIFVSSRINLLMNDCASARGSYPQGVTLHKETGKFRAQCRANGKNKNLGLFYTSKAASNAYKSFKSDLILSVASEQKDPLRTHLTRIAKEMITC